VQTNGENNFVVVREIYADDGEPLRTETKYYQYCSVDNRMKRSIIETDYLSAPTKVSGRDEITTSSKSRDEIEFGLKNAYL